MTGLISQTQRFAVVGLINTGIGLAAIYALMFFFQSGAGVANAIGYLIGLAVSFLLNRTWTFNSRRPVANVLPKYLLVAAISYLLNLGAVLTVIWYFSANPYLAQLLGVGIYTLCMFFGCRLFVFTITSFKDTYITNFTTPSFVTQIFQGAIWTVLLVSIPLALAVYVLGLKDWDFSIPLIYRNSDDIWQYTLTKVLQETGWILTNPYLGAPEVASWHHNAAAQTSALHSVLMLALSYIIENPVRLQQIYYLLNFPLIVLTSFIACRLIGVSRLPAFCVGLLFAFTTFRIDEMLYAFLSNYFMVPLALVAVIWVLSGKFVALAEDQGRTLRWWQVAVRLVSTREFILGLIFVALTAASDGYYAFFTLLLLGFAAIVRVLLGDWRRPLSLLPVGIYIFVLMGVTLSLMLPLHNYKKTHWNEFYPNGIEDPAMIKHPFEAEVYSSTLKMMIAPIQHHRIEYLGKVGKYVVATSDGARLYKNGRTLVPLGTLGSLLFAVALILLTVPSLRKNFINSLNSKNNSVLAQRAYGDALLSLLLFIFLCSILGGIGTLVALFFPTIRGYDRFPLFMIFVLYLSAASFVTLKLQNSGTLRRTAWIAVMFLVTAVSLYDQIPHNASKGNQKSKTQFLAERKFVQKIKAALTPNAMVYQYPYSQYLRQNDYYGWGSFSHIRLYLHSHKLRWSNGGAKNSPADNWNFGISQLPLDNLIAEVEAVGFSGFVIDRKVVKARDYKNIRKVFESKGYEILEDSSSKFTFVQLRDPGYRLVYEPTYREANHLVVTNLARLLAQNHLPRHIDFGALRSFLRGKEDKVDIVIRKDDHPEIFVDSSMFTRGFGQDPIKPISDMRGKMGCKVEGGTSVLILTLENQSRFDWKLNNGQLPIRIGYHIRQPDGKLLLWDDGFRVPTDAYIRRGATSTIRLPINTIPLREKVKSNGPLVVEFVLVQDGHAWFANVSCKVRFSEHTEFDKKDLGVYSNSQ